MLGCRIKLFDHEIHLLGLADGDGVLQIVGIAGPELASSRERVQAALKLAVGHVVVLGIGEGGRCQQTILEGTFDGDLTHHVRRRHKF